MALYECPECGEMVSTAAKFCPHCGFTDNSEPEPVATIDRDELLRGYWWRCFPMLVVRWVVFVPMAFLAAILIQVLTLFPVAWLFESGTRFIIFGLFLGGIFIVGWLAWIFYFIGIGWILSCVCPRPKIGSIIFMTLWVLVEIWVVWSNFSHELDTRWPLLVEKAFFMLAMIWIVAAVYENGEKLFEK